MKNNNLININKKLGVSTKWTFLEGFSTSGLGEKVEVYKFGNTINYLHCLHIKDNDQSDNSYYKSRERSEEIRGSMTIFLFVIKFYTDTNCIVNKYYVSTTAQNSEKYPHHVEDIISYFRRNARSKHLFWNLERYFKLEEYRSLWQIFAFYSFDWGKDTFFLASEIQPLPVVKKWVKRYGDFKVRYRDLRGQLHYSVKIPNGIFGKYSKPIELSGSLDASYVLRDIEGRKEGWEDILRQGMTSRFDSRFCDDVKCIFIEEEGRLDRERNIKDLPSQMRKEVKDYIKEYLISYMTERIKLSFRDSSELLTIEDDEEFVKLFDVKARYPEFDNTGGIFFKAKLGNHTMYSTKYVSPDFEKLGKINFFDNIEPNDIIRGGNFLDILVPSWKTPGIWLGFHIPLDTIRNVLKYYRYCGEGIESAIKLILIGQYINKEDSRDLPLDYVVKAININTEKLVDISSLFEYDSIGRFVDTSYAYHVAKYMVEFSTIKELDELKYN